MTINPNPENVDTNHIEEEEDEEDEDHEDHVDHTQVEVSDMDVEDEKYSWYEWSNERGPTANQVITQIVFPQHCSELNKGLPEGAGGQEPEVPAGPAGAEG